MARLNKKSGAGTIAQIFAGLGNNEGMAIKIPSTQQTERRLTIMASQLPQPAAAADVLAIYARLMAWTQQEPNDDDMQYLDPVSVYFGKLPGRVLLDTMVSVARPFI